MKTPARTVLLTALAVVAAGLAGCGSGDDTAATSTTTTVAETTTTTTTAEATTTTTEAAPTTTTTTGSGLPAGVDQLVTVSFAGGKVSPAPSRVKVKLGSTVRFTVTSDKADEIHLHGYDKSADVKAGGSASITFKAGIPGSFEVELEDLGKRLTTFQVQ